MQVLHGLDYCTFVVSFVTLIPKYFTLFDVVINGIVFISFSDCLFLVYKNILDFLYIDLEFCNIAQLIY